MNFASWSFVLLFLPAVAIGFRLLRGRNVGHLRLGLLVVASAGFYAVSGVHNALVLAGSLILNLVAGKLLTAPQAPTRRRAWIMWTAVLLNLSVLAGFKILALQSSASNGFRVAESILIPLALSFVTFQQIGFIVACYRRRVQAFALHEYLFFVLFFPQLIMGPIVRFPDVLAQLRGGALARSGTDDLAVGLSIFAFGLAQKVLLADQLAPAVDGIFELAPVGISTSEAWFAIIGFQLQLYFDFAGYADMAIGLGRMFGIRLPINFDRPLFAIDRFDLWRRWHITFVMFMRSHVFLPLVRHWRWPIPVALAVTGILSGLWHGLGWTFVLWGFVQTAILLIAHERRKRWRPLPGAALATRARAILLTFLTTALVGAMFRTPAIGAVTNVYGALAGFGVETDFSALGLRAQVMLPLCILLAWGMPSSAQLFRGSWNAIDPRPDRTPTPLHPWERRFAYSLTSKWAVAFAALLVLCLAMIGEARRFVYVQF
jgi:D-alanyl-lipoteichoic acid acyltransferase DltB (MBOAT superfamily)